MQYLRKAGPCLKVRIVQKSLKWSKVFYVWQILSLKNPLGVIYFSMFLFVAPLKVIFSR